MLELKQDVVDQMVRHCEEIYPHECCGLLVGTSDGTTRVGLELHRAGNLNTERAHDRYVLDPQDFQKIDLLARSKKLDIVGIYHSHPDHPSMPSQFDLDHAWEGYSYIVLEVAKGHVASYRTWEKRDEQFHQEDLRVQCSQPV